MNKNITSLVSGITGCLIFMCFIVRLGIENHNLDVIPIHDIPKENELSYIIKGFTLINYSNSERVIRISAEEASIKNKTLGFFRIGGLKQLEFIKMSVDFYESALNTKKIEKNETTTDLKDIRNKNLMSGLLGAESLFTSGQNLSGFVAYDFQIRIHHSDKTVTIMQGKYLSLNDKQTMMFKGNAAISYQNKMLISNDMVYDFIHGTIMSEKEYVLLSDNGKIHGKGMTADLRLRPI